MVSLSTSKLGVATKASYPGRCTFMVSIESADSFLSYLVILSVEARSAVLLVKNAKIQILSPAAHDDDIYALFEMDASFAASWGLAPFAIHLNLPLWIRLLQPPIDQRPGESLWIYNIGASPDPALYCLVGNDEEPVGLGVPEFVKENRISDVKSLRRLPSHPVKVHMTGKSLREVISALVPGYDHVGLMVMNDRVTWHSVGREFTYAAEDGHCKIEGVEEGTACYMVVKWRRPGVLLFAARFCEDVSMSCSLVLRDWFGWIRFSCLLVGIFPLMFLMRGSTYQVQL